MENAADGLKMAFAIFLFVIAVSFTFVAISQAREVADVMLYALDITNFHPTYTEKRAADGTIQVTNEEDEVVMALDEKRNRIVGADTVISMIYRYHRESLCIVIKDKNNNVVGRFDLNTEPYAIWRGNTEDTDTRIDYFIQGQEGTINEVRVRFARNASEHSGGQNSDGSYTIAERKFNKTARYKEEFAEVQYNGSYIDEDDGSQVTTAQGGRTIYITYTEI